MISRKRICSLFDILRKSVDVVGSLIYVMRYMYMSMNKSMEIIWPSSSTEFLSHWCFFTSVTNKQNYLY